MKIQGQQKQHVCRKVPLLFEQSLVWRLGCAQCEVDAMGPSMLEWCTIAVHKKLPDKLIQEVAAKMRHFSVHPLWAALSQKKEVGYNDAILVICDNHAVARMGMFGFKKTVLVHNGFRNNYKCMGRTICFCDTEEDARLILHTLRQASPGLEIMVLKITGYKLG